MDLLGRMGEVETRRTLLRDVDGPVTAHAALRIAWPAATARDPAARMRLITSSEDLDEQGLASRWEFQLDYPARYAQATLTVGINPDSDDEDGRADELVERVHPFVPPGDLWELMREGEEALRATLDAAWRRHLSGRPPLPLPGYDSPVAVAALLRQGAILRGGTYLGARLQVTEEAVWYIQGEDQVYTTSFGPAALPPGAAAELPAPPGS
ncbi:MAG TPA: hypothetical protein VM536_08450 [Chloroflexia bacterium]|nr:hypothetical protein [Chloroflexia bacterium]